MEAFWSLSNLLNFLTGGDIGERFCSRAFRNTITGRHPRWLWRAAHRVCDTVCFCEDDHCCETFLRSGR